MLQPRYLAGLLCRRLACSRAAPAVSMLAPASMCQPKMQAVWSRRSFSTEQEPNDPDGCMKMLYSLMETLSNMDGSWSFAERGFNLLQTLRRSQVLAPSQGLVECHDVLADEIAQTFQMMTSGEDGKPPLQPSTQAGMQYLQRLMYKQFANLVVYQLLAGRNHCRCRIVDGALVIQCWNGFTLPDLFSKLMGGIPKIFRPMCRPMSDADVQSLQQSDVFSAVLSCAQASDQSQHSPKDDATIHGIKQSREEWVPSQAHDAPHEPDAGKVRRLGRVKDAYQVASFQDDVYVSAWKRRIVRLGVDGQTEINSSGLRTLRVGMAVSEDIVVGHDFSNILEVGRLSSGNEVKRVAEVEARATPKGFSLTDSHAYFCQGEGVSCLDLETFKIHSVMGRPAVAGSGSIDGVGTEWTNLLLRHPFDTAVVDSKLFVADTGNSRVLCLDMERDQCCEVFKGKVPSLLAADYAGVFVYDEGQNKIFHVTMDTWDVSHVLGTGVSEYSPDGFPPLSTNLSLVRSMAIRPDRELVYLFDNSDVVYGFKLPQLATSNVLPEGPLSATQLPIHDQVADAGDDVTMPQNSGAALQPTCGVQFARFSKQPSQMILSDSFPRDRNNVKVKLAMEAPSKGLGICVVPCTQDISNKKTVDCHMLSPPECKETYVTTLSTMRQQAALQDQPFRKAWKAAMDAFRTWLSRKETKPSAFFLNQNHFDVFVERIYDPDADSSTWKVIKVMINGKERAGALEPLTVGVDVPVRLCLFSAEKGGVLELFGAPKVLAS